MYSDATEAKTMDNHVCPTQILILYAKQEGEVAIRPAMLQGVTIMLSIVNAGMELLNPGNNVMTIMTIQETVALLLAKSKMFAMSPVAAPILKATGEQNDFVLTPTPERNQRTWQTPALGR